MKNFKNKLVMGFFALAFTLGLSVAGVPYIGATEVKANTVVKTIVNDVPAGYKFDVGSEGKQNYTRYYMHHIAGFWSDNGLSAIVSNEAYKIYAVAGEWTEISVDNYENRMDFIFAFMPGDESDPNVVLDSVTYTENFKSFIYTSSGANPNTTVTPYNWVHRTGKGYITLKFKYLGALPNPIIPEPTIETSKKIDYLGDGVANAETTSKGVNDYRVYLTATTSSRIEQPATTTSANIVFVVNTSLEGGNSVLSSVKSELQKTTKKLLENSGNRISIIGFDENPDVLIQDSGSSISVTNAIGNLSTSYGNNMYKALKATGDLVASLDNSSRETVVIWVQTSYPNLGPNDLTDSPKYLAIRSNTFGYMYAIDGASEFNKLTSYGKKVDRFYGVYYEPSSSNFGLVSLKNVIENISVKQLYAPKGAVKATSLADLNTKMYSFVDRVQVSIENPTIQDTLSKYVDFKSNVNVTKIVDGVSLPLVAGVDYTIGLEDKIITVSFTDLLAANSTYGLAYNVTSNGEAMREYKETGYPNVGDPNTDYGTNKTSSGQPGFYTSSSAKFLYTFGSRGAMEKSFSKPVVQVVVPPAITSDLVLYAALSGRTIKDGEFTFNLYDANTGALVTTAKNDASGKIVFPVNYEYSGEYKFYATQVIPAVKETGVTYSEEKITVPVVVDGTTGTLIAKPEYPSDITFNNAYKPLPVKVSLTTKVTYTNGELKAGMFEFYTSASVGGSKLEWAKNDASGNVTFSPITLSEAGTHVYYITQGFLDNPQNPRIKYDLEPMRVLIDVVDVNGQLKATVAYSKLTFSNSFVPDPAYFTAQSKVILTGMKLQADMFGFVIKDNNGLTVATTKNDINGDIFFEDIKVTSAGNFTYTITQKIPGTTAEGKIDNMIYDESIVTCKIVVKQVGNALAITDITYGMPEYFYNTYRNRGTGQ